MSFGPVSLSAMERDEYERVIQNYLPAAHFAFLDEMFKANSAILNSLLCILNERLFNNGHKLIKVPLLSVIGASNEYPEAGLEALYDRFLFRVLVKPVTEPKSFAKMIKCGLSRKKESVASGSHIRSTILSIAELRALNSKSFPTEMFYDSHLQFLASLNQSLRRESVDTDITTANATLLEDERERYIVSNRRFVEIARVVQVSGYTHGRTRVSWIDFLFLPHTLWNHPDDFDEIKEIFFGE
jgi:MoxR-like ATPase